LFGAPEAEAPTWAHAQSTAQIMAFAGLTVFFLSIGSTAIYTYTPELHPTEIRTTAMGIASAWGRVGALTMLLVFGHYFAILGKSLFFLVVDPVLIGAQLRFSALALRLGEGRF
jgi:putative MFS transporter